MSHALRRPVPLNSKRLTAPVLKQLVKGLEVPTAGSAEEIRQLIEGELGEKNTQVLVQEDEHGVRVCLQDADGVFLEVEAEAGEGA